MANNPRPDLDLVQWGARGLWAQRGAIERLEADLEAFPSVRRVLWEAFQQGYGHAAASVGTHDEGWCLDFSMRRPDNWSTARCILVAQVLNRWWATAFRAAGELGPNNPPHLHCAYFGKANYHKVVAANKSKTNGLRRRIERAVSSL